MIIEFTISIEVSDPKELDDIDDYTSEQMDAIMTMLEDVINKTSYTLNDSNWEAYD
jgi:N-acetyl-anhydromuramyl-L-alanine amidase AmpD